MAGVQLRFGYPGLKIGYTAFSAIVGGQVVERVAGARLVQPAGAGSLVVAGVAMFDVPATRTVVGGPVVGDVNALMVIRRVVIPVTFNAAATEGQKLICAAAGQVTPAGAASDARTIIGEAFEAVAGGAVGLVLVY